MSTPGDPPTATHDTHLPVQLRAGRPRSRALEGGSRVELYSTANTRLPARSRGHRQLNSQHCCCCCCCHLKSAAISHTLRVCSPPAPRTRPHDALRQGRRYSRPGPLHHGRSRRCSYRFHLQAGGQPTTCVEADGGQGGQFVGSRHACMLLCRAPPPALSLRDLIWCADHG